MSIFTKILGALGIGSAQAKTKQVDERPYGPKTVPPGTVGPGSLPGATQAGSAITQPIAISEVDVVAQLEKRAAAHGEKLNWRTSIVDLLKLLDIDSSLSERKELATELGIPANLMSDSASMNIWLHKEVLKRIAANGGNVPANLLD